MTPKVNHWTSKSMEAHTTLMLRDQHLQCPLGREHGSFRCQSSNPTPLTYPLMRSSEQLFLPWQLLNCLLRSTNTWHVGLNEWINQHCLLKADVHTSESLLNSLTRTSIVNGVYIYIYIHTTYTCIYRKVYNIIVQCIYKNKNIYILYWTSRQHVFYIDTV